MSEWFPDTYGFIMFACGAYFGYRAGVQSAKDEAEDEAFFAEIEREIEREEEPKHHFPL